MKHQNLKIAGIPLLAAVFAVITGTAVLFSCKKSIAPSAAKNDMVAIKKLTGGHLLTGPVTVETGNEGLLLNVTNGATQILVLRAAGSAPAPLHNMAAAQVVVSTHGVVVKDLASNQVFFLTNNDGQSIANFSKAQSLIKTPAYNDRIIGTTVVQSKKS